MRRRSWTLSGSRGIGKKATHGSLSLVSRSRGPDDRRTDRPANCTAHAAHDTTSSPHTAPGRLDAEDPSQPTVERDIFHEWKRHRSSARVDAFAERRHRPRPAGRGQGQPDNLVAVFVTGADITAADVDTDTAKNREHGFGVLVDVACELHLNVGRQSGGFRSTATGVQGTITVHDTSES